MVNIRPLELLKQSKQNSIAVWDSFRTSTLVVGFSMPVVEAKWVYFCTSSSSVFALFAIRRLFRTLLFRGSRSIDHGFILLMLDLLNTLRSLEVDNKITKTNREVKRIK